MQCVERRAATRSEHSKGDGGTEIGRLGCLEPRRRGCCDVVRDGEFNV